MNYKISGPQIIQGYDTGYTWLLDRITAKLSRCENVILAAPHGWGKKNFAYQAAFFQTIYLKKD